MSEKHDKHKKEEKEESNDEDSLNKLNINEEFAERFQHNEKRKKEEKLRNKYGVNIKNKEEEEENDGEESPEESEDSEGELDNEIVRDKFINTLLELKDEKETKKLIENKTPIFTDDDFQKKREKIHKKEEPEKIEYGR